MIEEFKRVVTFTAKELEGGAGDAAKAQKVNARMLRASGAIREMMLKARQLNIMRTALDEVVQLNNQATGHFNLGMNGFSALFGSIENEHAQAADSLGKQALGLTTGRTRAGTEDELTIPQKIQGLYGDLDFLTSTFQVILDKATEMDQRLADLGLDFKAVEEVALNASNEAIQFRNSV